MYPEHGGDCPCVQRYGFRRLPTEEETRICLKNLNLKRPLKTLGAHFIMSTNNDSCFMARLRQTAAEEMLGPQKHFDSSARRAPGSGLEVQCNREDRMAKMEQEGVSTNVPPEFPYCFDCEGRLLHRDTGGPFQCRRGGEGLGRGEAEMEALWGYITRHVYTLLEGRCGLTRLLLPPPCLGTVFLSQGALESREPLLVLIQDRGTIRSGQWSWRAVVRDGLETGSQVGYVCRAAEERWGVILLNPNEKGASPEEHVRRVWDCLLVKGVGPVAMVTHGYGGLAFVDLLARRPQEVMQLVRAVAFIDSVHNPWHQPLGGAARDWLRAHSRKWVLSDKPLNRPVSSLKADTPQLSAGTLSHEHAPTSCLDAVFRYITKALRAKAPPTPFNIITRSKSQGRSWPPGRGARPRLANGGKI